MLKYSISKNINILLLKQGRVASTVCAARAVSVSAATRAFPLARSFSVTSIPLAKKKGGKAKAGSHEAEESASEQVSISSLVDLADLKIKFQGSVDAFKERTTVIRQGKITPAVIEEIIVTTHNHTEEPLKNIARVALKGPRTMSVTVFEPRDVKHITAAVIASGLNLNPQPDPKSPEQILRLPLPPTTSETKKEVIKDLKHEFEVFRNSPSRKSLTTVRENALKHVKKAGKTLSKDRTFEVKGDIEELFKTAAKNLADALKQAEAATMKD